MNIFESAAKLKLRFQTAKGSITVEDLYDLPLSTKAQNGVSLDTVAIAIHKELKESSEISFVSEVSHANTVMQLRMDIVKHIIEDRKALNAQRAEAIEKSKKKSRLLELINRKQDEALEGKSLEELTAMVEEL